MPPVRVHTFPPSKKTALLRITKHGDGFFYSAANKSRLVARGYHSVAAMFASLPVPRGL